MAKNGNKRVTILEVAQASGVSYQTVSRVINNHPNVAEETRMRVQEVIERLDYHPSKAARSLASQKSSTLAVITYGMEYFGPTQMVVNIERHARDAGYDLIYSNVDPTSDDDINSRIKTLAQWSVDGIVLIAPVKSYRYSQFLKNFASTPMIQIDIAPDTNVPSVIIDQYHGGLLATQHLLDLGHRDFCTIHGPLSWYGAQSRLNGYHTALKSAGIQSLAEAEGDWTAQSGYSATKTIFSQHDFTALVAGNDQMALGTIRALADLGKRVPEDVSVIGFDDIPEAEFFLPALTTIKQEFRLLGKMGIEYLIHIINDPDSANGQQIITPELVIRQSTAPPATR